MKFVMTDYHGHREPLAGPDDAGEWFDEQASSIMPHGGCGQTMWFGPSDASPELRIDVDVPGWLARVGVDTARQAVVEYVSTGQRPTCLTWSSAERSG